MCDYCENIKTIKQIAKDLEDEKEEPPYGRVRVK